MSEPERKIYIACLPGDDEPEVQILGVFSSREAAADWLAKNGWGESGQVLEFPVHDT